ncbi:MAG TPA: MarR family transcriptional regulator [Gemmatimonadales bacterium]|nr:MarR family transcriptional regulator [Gemmatimonadales bacterium]
MSSKPQRGGGGGRGRRRHDPAVVEEAEATLGHIDALWRGLFHNPFEEARQAGLTGPQVRVMASLVRRGNMTLSELSRTLGLSHSTASGIVDRLEARGLVRRSPDARDRRRTSLAVTDMVTGYVHELNAGPAGRLVAVLGAASAGERRAIKRGLITLRELLEHKADS